MNRKEAEALAGELVELAVEGEWAELVKRDLPGELLELLRQKAQLNAQVANLEQQERVLWLLLIEMLQPAAPTPKAWSNGAASQPQHQAAGLAVG